MFNMETNPDQGLEEDDSMMFHPMYAEDSKAFLNKGATLANQCEELVQKLVDLALEADTPLAKKAITNAKPHLDNIMGTIYALKGIGMAWHDLANNYYQYAGFNSMEDLQAHLQKRRAEEAEAVRK